MRILHASDLHFSSVTGEDQSRLINAFLEDASIFHDEKPVDAIFFTGDLANAGADDEFAAGKKLLLDPLCQRLDVENGRVFIVPGNHDVTRAQIDPYLETGIDASLNSRDAVLTLEDNPTALENATRRLDQFRNFDQDFYTGVSRATTTPFAWTSVLNLDGQSVGVACLNSAWRASGGPEDRGRVMIGDRQITRAFEAIKDVDLRLIAVHHPLDWLRSFDGDNAHIEYELQPSIVMTGHTHIPDPTSEISSRGSAIYSRAGCLYESTDYLNGYSIIDVDFDARGVCVRLRSWYAKRREFDDAVHMVRGGALELPLPARRSALPALSVSHSVIANRLSAVIVDNSLLAEHVDQGALQRPADLLVPPRFLSLPYREALAATRIAEELPDLDAASVAGALQEDKVVVINGEAGSGITMGLYWLLSQSLAADSERLPLRVTFDPAFKDTRFERTLMDAARQIYAFPDDELPSLTIALDDVRVRSSAYLEAFARYVQENPHHRYVVGSHGDVHGSIVRALKSRDVPCEAAFLGPFGRSQLRRLLVSTVGGAQANDVLARVVKIAALNELPRTPMIMAALASVVIKHPDVQTINESGLLDAYVKLMIGEDGLQSVDDLGMDYRRREHLLSWLAEIYSRRRFSRLTRFAAEAEVASYFGSIGASESFSPGLVLENLIQRRVLVEDWEGVGFRHPAFLSLFAGKRMLEHPEFADMLLADPLPNRRAVIHAAGLRRSDNALLKRVGEACAPILGAVPLADLVDAFNAIKDRPGWSSGTREVEDFKRRLEAMPPPLEPGELDETLDEIDDDVALQRANDDDGKAFSAMRELSLALELASSVVRGSELVNDVALKENELKRAIHGWATLAVMLAVEEDQHREFAERLVSLFGGDDATREIVERIERLSDLLVILTGLFVSDSMLGSPYLVGVLDNILDDEEFMGFPLYALFSTFLYCQLRRRDWPLRLRKLHERHGKHPVILELVEGLALIPYRTDPAIRRGDLSHLELLISEVWVPAIDPNGRPSPSESRARSRIVSELRIRRSENLRQRQDESEEDGEGPSDEPESSALLLGKG